MFEHGYTSEFSDFTELKTDYEVDCSERGYRFSSGTALKYQFCMGEYAKWWCLTFLDSCEHYENNLKQK